MRSIKIGTRNSPLALWQARSVARHLQNLNYVTEIIPILSSGDKNLHQPLYSMGIVGIFTKDLDIALLNHEIDIAVHSLKDVPTMLPENIEVMAVLERDFPEDVLVRAKHAKDKPLDALTVASGSLRRRAFWRRKFPNTEFAEIRGNVQSRLRKINEGLADATIFSQAGLERMELKLDYEPLPFLLSAPSQGVVAVAGRNDDVEIRTILEQVNHIQTHLCITIERDFLRTLEGGCTAPIGALAKINDKNEVHFQGWLSTIDGTKCIEIERVIAVNECNNAGELWAKEIIKAGGESIMNQLKSNNNWS